MEKGKDYDQNFSPTPGIAIARIITSIPAANDLELLVYEVLRSYTEIPCRHEPYIISQVKW
jgi:hypothetical protein